MKAFIVGGGGLLGSTTAFCLAEKELCDEIVLYDMAPALAEHHAFDISQALCMFSKTKVRAGGWDDINDSALVVSAAGIGLDKHTSDDVANIGHLLPLINALGTALKNGAQDAVVLSMTNPIDSFNYLLHKVSGLPRERFLGYSLNDTIRFCAGLGELFGADTRDIEAYTVGEHGPTKVQLLSSVKVKNEKKAVSQSDAERLRGNLDRQWKGFLNLGIKRTAGWTSAAGGAYMVEALFGSCEETIACSCIPDGEYGLSGLSIGLPAKLGPKGVTKIVELELTADEAQGLKLSAEKISGVIAGAQEKYPELNG